MPSTFHFYYNIYKISPGKLKQKIGSRIKSIEFEVANDNDETLIERVNETLSFLEKAANDNDSICMLGVLLSSLKEGEKLKYELLEIYKKLYPSD